MRGAGIGPAEVRMQVKVRIFSSNARSMGDICSEAADFASSLIPTQLINISHTKEDAAIWVAVWYWDMPTRGE